MKAINLIKWLEEVVKDNPDIEVRVCNKEDLETHEIEIDKIITIFHEGYGQNKKPHVYLNVEIDTNKYYDPQDYETQW